VDIASVQESGIISRHAACERHGGESTLTASRPEACITGLVLGKEYRRPAHHQSQSVIMLSSSQGSGIPSARSYTVSTQVGESYAGSAVVVGESSSRHPHPESCSLPKSKADNPGRINNDNVSLYVAVHGAIVPTRCSSISQMPTTRRFIRQGFLDFYSPCGIPLEGWDLETDAFHIASA
jgi:hypothetical protein